MQEKLTGLSAGTDISGSRRCKERTRVRRFDLPG